MGTRALDRVLIVWQSTYPWEVRVEKMAHSLRDRGSRVCILARGTPGAVPHEVQEGIEIRRVLGRLATPLPYSPIWLRALHQACDAFVPTLLVARDIPLASVVETVARRRSIPVVLDMAEHYPGAMRSWKKYQQSVITKTLVHRLKLPDWVEARAVRHADAVVTVCEEQVERLMQQYGVSADRLVVVNNTPCARWFAQAPHKGVRQPPRVLGHHGHMTPERGLSLLLEGFSRVASEFPHLELHLAGAGESEADVRAQAGRLGLGERVTLSGRFVHKDLPVLYGAIDIGVLPYPPNELIDHTLSNKIFDYFTMGKPVLTSAARPMTRLLRETGAGRAFSPWTAEALALALRELLRGDLQGMSQAGLAASARYVWEQDAARLVRFLETRFG